ncbi:sulfotransferase family protein [Sulfitobacter aestuarii]|uniref:Sulfotransferase family protein n=1 Tax=Sulfitobacter aestuarii TaxID=2161676 RepID=A0ABW5U2L2_9RHOB
MTRRVIGIGGQKCASSWLHAIAGSHPQIAVSEPKEVDFFSYYFDRGYRWYEGHFPAAPGRMALFESSPSYLIDPRAAERAARFDPQMKILALLRDPIARAFSNHMHEIVKGHIAPCTFEEGLRNNPCYLDQGLYARHLRPWFDAFPAASIKVLFAEEIGADPAGTAVEVFDFIGVDPGFRSAILSERRNESDRPRHALLRKSLRGGGDWLRRQGMEPALARIKSQKLVARLLAANSISIKSEIPPMRPETRDMLIEHFAADVAALADLLQVTPPWEAWKTTVVARDRPKPEASRPGKESADV